MAADAGGSLHILLVEDNDIHAELVIRGMGDSLVANKIPPVPESGQVLDYFIQRGAYTNPVQKPRPNSVLPDLRLPRVDGLEVLRIVKTTHEILRIPGVILTSSDAENDSAKFCDYHANSYVVKPPDFKTFTKLVKDLGFSWLGWNVKSLSG
ncbi:MAG: response regulator [Methanoregula sp.]|jgi:CheY-like chemotaxis protein|nr:response regulator [Methanoregula sp.]